MREHDKLAIGYKVVPNGPDFFHKLREILGQVAAAARLEPNHAARLADQAAEAVVLKLENPAEGGKELAGVAIIRSR